MNAAALVLTRAVTSDECPWLNTDLAAGDTVYRFFGYTYGCIGPKGIAVIREPGVGPFFEVPLDAIAPRDGAS